MNLEVLINPAKAEGRPWEIFFAGKFYAFVSVLLSTWLFSAYASIAIIMLTVSASLPLVFSLMSLEESETKRIKKEYVLFKHHERALKVLVFLFAGFVSGYTLWFMILQPDQSSRLFEAQLMTIAEINDQNQVSAMFHAEAKEFFVILLNNLKVLGFVLLFSLLFGAGAVVIMAWNASVMAAAIGTMINSKILSDASYTALFWIASHSLLRYSLHGVGEVIAYFLASLAGGIVYVAVVKREVNKHMVYDSAVLLGAAIVFLVLAAVVEVVITPYFY